VQIRFENIRYFSKHSETRNIKEGAYCLPYVIKGVFDLLVDDTVKNVKFHPEEGGSILRRTTVT